jgi:hypothetical protein
MVSIKIGVIGVGSIASFKVILKNDNIRSPNDHIGSYSYGKSNIN